MTWCFVERKIKKTTLEHPFFLYAILFLNNKHVKVNDVANQILSYSLLIFLNNFIAKYVRSSIISKVLVE